MENESRSAMTGILASNIVSSLGSTTGQNFLSARSLVPPAGRYDDFEPIQGFTRFQSLVIKSISDALLHADVDVSSERTVFILSTTQADIAELSSEPRKDGAYCTPGESAGKIASYFGFITNPLVICNACISGVTAQIIADRLLKCGKYDTAVVSGADCLTEFAKAGFDSFKSLSTEPCRPFDIERTGLNLGEAASTMVLARISPDDERWKIAATALTNDAYHVSAPDPKGDGVTRAIAEAMGTQDFSALSTVTAHGTATMFNDQMESKALENAGMSEVMVTAYKGQFGHTLGASGILESALTMESIDRGILIPVKGYKECGVSGKINICSSECLTDKKSFLKIISGFGGCNGAILYTREKAQEQTLRVNLQKKEILSVKISPSSFSIGGREVIVAEKGGTLLTEVFRRYLDDNMKFYKMDCLSRLIYLSAGILLKESGIQNDAERTGTLIFNRSSSVVANRNHIKTFKGGEGYYPSPSIFLYTLPNVVLGEIAVKYGLKGESDLIILDKPDRTAMEEITDATFACTKLETIICGWADCPSENEFEAEMKLISLT